MADIGKVLLLSRWNLYIIQAKWAIIYIHTMKLNQCLLILEKKYTSFPKCIIISFISYLVFIFIDWWAWRWCFGCNTPASATTNSNSWFVHSLKQRSCQLSKLYHLKQPEHIWMGSCMYIPLFILMFYIHQIIYFIISGVVSIICIKRWHKL